jgi:hypothetical protein
MNTSKGLASFVLDCSPRPPMLPRVRSFIRLQTVLCVTVVTVLGSGCVRRIALGAVANALSGSGGSFGQDNDPELVQQALPFALKTMESIVPEQPNHKGLLAATAGGYTQYAYGFLVPDAEALEGKNSAQANHLKNRARNLLQRARRYGIQGLSLTQKDFEAAVRKDSKGVLAKFEKEDVPLLYWTGAAWAAEVTLDKENLELVADLPLVEKLLRRALELDEGFDSGAIHEVLMSYELARPDGGPEAVVEAKKHFERAKQLSGNKRMAVLVSWAESDAVKRQDKALFNSLLDQVLAFNPDDAPEFRLANVIAQNRAKRLKARTDDLFL